MRKKYIVGIDQSTQGTKALLLDENGILCGREDISHRQIVNEKGWVSHNPEEIYYNTIQVTKKLINHANIDKNCIVGIGLSNQRETSIIWDKESGRPLADAIVWQCTRAEEICKRLEMQGYAKKIWEKTGLRLSPYFPAAKIAWFLEQIEGAKEKADQGKACHGTIDTWLIYKLTQEKSYKTDYSNASRTQLFDIFRLQWDEEICNLFGIRAENMPEVCDSDSDFGTTTLEGYLEYPIPIRGVLGDSHGALFGQGCLRKGMIKATYGTGSSIMMNIGSTPILNVHGTVTSLAWSLKGKVNYVLEGNINYTGAVVSWMQNNMGLIENPGEAEEFCQTAKNQNGLYLVPAFTGLGAPYWDTQARASIVGIDRTTGKKEIVKAGIECIAYQIVDVVNAMSEEAGVSVEELRVDGGPTKNKYLMQFQSDILNKEVLVSEIEELSGMGVAYVAGISLGIYTDKVFENRQWQTYKTQMNAESAKEKYCGWRNAVKSVLSS